MISNNSSLQLIASKDLGYPLDRSRHFLQQLPNVRVSNDNQWEDFIEKFSRKMEFSLHDE